MLDDIVDMDTLLTPEHNHLFQALKFSQFALTVVAHTGIHQVVLGKIRGLG